MKHIIYKIVILNIVFTLVSCENKENQMQENNLQNSEIADDRIKISQVQFEQLNMRLGKLEEKPFHTVVKSNGLIDVPPENRAVVSATIGGYVDTTPLLIGDKVKKGQTLLTIGNPKFISMQQEFMEISEQMSYLKADFERQKTMMSENITSQKSFLKAESAYKSALATHKGLRKQLELLNISVPKLESGNITSVVAVPAPISGSITKINIVKGMYVSPTTMIMEIIDNDHIHLELSVFEKDIMKLNKGQKINFKIPEASDEIYEAEVYLIGTSITENRTIKVHGHMKGDATNNFLIGMFVDATIITDSTVAPSLPNEAIVNVDGINQILVLDEKTEGTYFFKTINVKVKDNYQGFSLIENVNDFNSDSKVLLKGAFNLLGE